MKLGKLKSFLNNLSDDFNDIKINVKLGDYDHDGIDVKLHLDEIQFKIENYSIFDSINSSLKLVNWDRNAKLQIIKALKDYMGLGLIDVKELVDKDQPIIVDRNKSRSEYDKIVKEYFPNTAVFEID